MTAIHDKVRVYVDGSCPKPDGPGGWAWVAVDSYGKEFLRGSGGCIKATNNTMELTAAIEGVRALESYYKEFSAMCSNSIAGIQEVYIVSDSQYVTKGMTEWYETWARKQFHKVKNPHLWRVLKAVTVGSPFDIGWRWVKGHKGNPNNELADKLAGEASRAYKDRSGDAA